MSNYAKQGAPALPVRYYRNTNNVKHDHGLGELVAVRDVGNTNGEKLQTTGAVGVLVGVARPVFGTRCHRPALLALAILAAAAVQLLAGCGEHMRDRDVGDTAADSPESCARACAPYAWSLRLETYISREHGCTCFGTGAEVAR